MIKLVWTTGPELIESAKPVHDPRIVGLAPLARPKLRLAVDRKTTVNPGFQTSLFARHDKRQIVIMSMDAVKGAQFRAFLEEHKPALILEARKLAAFSGGGFSRSEFLSFVVSNSIVYVDTELRVANRVYKNSEQRLCLLEEKARRGLLRSGKNSRGKVLVLSPSPTRSAEIFRNIGDYLPTYVTPRHWEVVFLP